MTALTFEVATYSRDNYEWGGILGLCTQDKQRGANDYSSFDKYGIVYHYDAEQFILNE